MKDKYDNILDIGDRVIRQELNRCWYMSTVAYCETKHSLVIPSPTFEWIYLKYYSKSNYVILMKKFEDYGELTKVDDYVAIDSDRTAHVNTDGGIMGISVTISQ